MWFEKLIESWGLKASLLMASGSWWRRVLGTLLACAGLWLIVLLATTWVVFGKKPKAPPVNRNDRNLH